MESLNKLLALGVESGLFVKLNGTSVIEFVFGVPAKEKLNGGIGVGVETFVGIIGFGAVVVASIGAVDCVDTELAIGVTVIDEVPFNKLTTAGDDSAIDFGALVIGDFANKLLALAD